MAPCRPPSNTFRLLLLPPQPDQLLLHHSCTFPAIPQSKQPVLQGTLPALLMDCPHGQPHSKTWQSNKPIILMDRAQGAAHQPVNSSLWPPVLFTGHQPNPSIPPSTSDSTPMPFVSDTSPLTMTTQLCSWPFTQPTMQFHYGILSCWLIKFSNIIFGPLNRPTINWSTMSPLTLVPCQ